MTPTKMRQWIQEERRYLWCVVFLILFHSTFSILNTLSGPLKKETATPVKESVSGEERWLTALKENESLQFLFGMSTLFVLLFLCLGLFLTVLFLIQKAQGKFVVPWRPPDPEILWGLKDVFHVVVLLVLCGYLIEFLQVLFLFFSSETISEGVRMLGTTLLSDLIVLFLIFRLVWVEKKQSLAHLGLSAKAFLKNFFFGLTSYATLMPALLFSLVVSLWLAALFKISPPKQPLYDLFTKEPSRGIFLFGLLLVTFVGPAIEEIFFRGFLYNALKVKWGKGWAVLSSGLLFAVLHANLVGFLPIAFLGCALAYGYELTGSLVTSITIHIVHNSVVMAVFLLTHHFSQLFGGV
ncbi:MAG: CPBP family intramembrane metalloprotease [Candidatus Omnitrophica bacterium]|nr:CPBP family intramembrane metalloprotease [Candidatus Omnitrophota bacterium]